MRPRSPRPAARPARAALCCALLAASSAARPATEPAPSSMPAAEAELLDAVSRIAWTAAPPPRAPAPTPAPAASLAAAEVSRWRLDEALGLPDWLRLSGHQRTRYEAFDEQFRAGRSGSGQGFFTRTALRATVDADPFEATLELLDSRQFDTPNDLPLNTTIVNAIDVLQARVGVSGEGALRSGDDWDLTLGRLTMDVGSRRLVARNRFRNTINAFTGLRGTWRSGSGTELTTFYVLPVQRLPRDAASLRDNEQEFDEERSQVRFFGLHVARAGLVGEATGELYAFGLDEEDGDELETRDRRLWTVGGRLVEEHRPGRVHYELEAAYQTGDSRASSSAADTADLDHGATFLHATLGYRWDADAQPRLEALFDWASGDDDPTDGEWNRFDTLYGARRFEYGPTGIYGAFARSNVLTPGVRFVCKPSPSTEVMVADRLFYLASARDAWTTSGLVDPSGDAGRYVGNQAEVRLRWDAAPSLRVETGLAQLFAGSFVEDAPNATTQGDTTYVYVATTLYF